MTPHVVVIGAGTLGMSTAVNLMAQGARVTVVEGGAVASGSSGRSVGVVGTQFTDAFDLMLRAHSMRQFTAWEAMGLRFNHIGYLRLARTPAQMALFEASVRMQAELGFRARVYQADQLTELVPHISSTGLEGGIFGPDNGFIDPQEMCLLLARLLREGGGTLRQFCKVTGLRRQDGYVLDTSGGEIACDRVVNAAGAWAGPVAALFGQTLHVRPERHEALQILLDAPLPYTMPMVMDLVNGAGTGLNFRHDKPGEMLAEIHKVASLAPEDPDRYNAQCEDSARVSLAEMLLERLPDLPGARLGRGWAGLYPTTADHRPFVGPIDLDEPGLITAAGAGGYGIQLAPVIGQLAADWALQGAPLSAPEAEILRPTPARNRPDH